MKITIGIGLPGSGKTTILRPFARNNGHVYISSDEIRAELTGNAADQSKNKEVWQKVYQRTEKALSEGRSLVIDAPFANQLQRRDYIKFAREHGADKIQGVLFNAPFEIANKRNKSRDRIVADHIMEKLRSMLEIAPAVIEDGFDDLLNVDEFLDLCANQEPS